MLTVTIEEAEKHLSELIDQLRVGEEVVILRNAQPVARLIGQPPPSRQPREPGLLRDKILYMAPDFDAPPEDFEEYMK